MKHKPSPIIIVLIVLGIVGATGYWYFSNNPAEWQQVLADFGFTATDSETAIAASGFIEADETKIATEVGGRIMALNAGEGDSVSAGEILVELDPALIDARQAQIEAEIALAEAQLAQIQAGVPAEIIAVAQAAVGVAEAKRDAAEQAIADAELLRDNPQQLNAQIDGAYSQYAINKLITEQLALLRDAIELRESIAAEFWQTTQEGLDYSVSIPVMPPGASEPTIIRKSGHFDFRDGEKYQASMEWNLATMDVWKAWVNYENAKSAEQSVLRKLNTLQELKANPLQANFQVAQAEAEYQTALAAVDVARAQVARVESGAPQNERQHRTGEGSPDNDANETDGDGQPDEQGMLAEAAKQRLTNEDAQQAQDRQDQAEAEPRQKLTPHDAEPIAQPHFTQRHGANDQGGGL